MHSETYRERPSCGRCGAAIERDVAEYADDGAQVCGACVEKASFRESAQRIRGATQGAAAMALFFGILSFACGGVVLAAISVGLGLGALGAARTAQLAGEGAAVGGTRIFAALAILAGSARVLLALTAVLLGR